MPFQTVFRPTARYLLTFEGAEAKRRRQDDAHDGRAKSSRSEVIVNKELPPTVLSCFGHRITLIEEKAELTWRKRCRRCHDRLCSAAVPPDF